jgi:hypothetical protein
VEAEHERQNEKGGRGKTEQGFFCTVLKTICFVTVFFCDKYVS